MKYIEQIIAIAEACGWAGIKNANTMAAQGVWIGYNPKCPIIGKPEYLPDYLHNLNAMNDAIKCLPPDKHVSSNPADYPSWMFVSNLSRVVGVKIFDNGNFVGSQQDLFKLANATAAQRAEAFLKTVGKWKD